jgi:von Willebrand factor type A domain-containing protein
MRSLGVKIATALITFILGVWFASLWVWPAINPAIPPVTTTNSTPTSDATLEMVFVVDTTGSMGGLIDGAKQRIWGIVNGVMQTRSHPAVRIGLVAYRDRGDDYVTKVVPLTDDLDKVYTTLMNYSADGGGDEAEDVRTALAEGVGKAGWSEASSNVAQILFLVGDAPPQSYYDVPDPLVTVAKAVDQGIVVNTIQCGNLPETTPVWKAIAHRGQCQYFSIPQNGGVIPISTPYDEQLSQLATDLGGTYISYGFGALPNAEEQRQSAREAAVEVERGMAAKVPVYARADRAYNKVLNTKAYFGDLLQDIENGTVKLENVKTEDLPNNLQSLSPAERQQEIEKQLAHRREMRAKIMELVRQKDAYIAEQKKTKGVQDGFDSVVTKALTEQLARKGIK